MTHHEIYTNIQKMPHLIIPLGGLEPFGNFGNLGINSLCINAIAGAVSQKLEMLLAPAIDYGCTTPFKSFHGAIGIKPKTFCSFLSSLCNDCFFQGFESVLILNSIEENDLALELLAKRYNNSCKKIYMFSLQSDKRVREFVASCKSGVELGRSEFMMLSMAAFIQPNLLLASGTEKNVKIPDPSIYKTWKKRGADPEKFRKLFPSGSASTIAQEYNPEIGGRIFNFIIDLLSNQYSQLAKQKTIDASS